MGFFLKKSQNIIKEHKNWIDRLSLTKIRVLWALVRSRPQLWPIKTLGSRHKQFCPPCQHWETWTDFSMVNNSSKPCPCDYPAPLKFLPGKAQSHQKEFTNGWNQNLKTRVPICQSQWEDRSRPSICAREQTLMA